MSNIIISSYDEQFSIHRYGMYASVFTLICLLLVLLIWEGPQKEEPWSGFRIPDETKAAEILLAQKLKGARYFELEAATSEVPFPFLTRTHARNQLARIAMERHFDSTGKAKLEKLVDRLIEPPFSRAGMSERINVLRLNLALDEMP